jgi:ribosome-binding ATPase
MKIGIAGHPFCGKSTVFSALTGQKISTSPEERTSTVSTVTVPDTRIDALSEIFSPKKTTYAVVEMVDAMGQDPAREADAFCTTSELESLKKCTALLNVVGCFNEEPGDVAAAVLKELDALRSEFIIADQAVVENNLSRLDRLSRKKNDREMTRRLELLEQCLQWFEAGEFLYDQNLPAEDVQALSGFSFLTLKPQLVALNVGESALASIPQIEEAVRAGVSAERTPIVTLSGQVEAELQELEDEDRTEFMAELGITTPGIDKVIQVAYDLLGLISFFTGGEDEVRAWPIRNGETAKEAAGAIHTDISDGFIKAEVVSYDDFVQWGSFASCRDNGVFRLEGKEYLVKDGDVINYRFNKP